MPIKIIKYIERFNKNLYFIFPSSPRAANIQNDKEVTKLINSAITLIDTHDFFSQNFSIENLYNKIINEIGFLQCHEYDLSKLIVERFLEQSSVTRWTSLRISNLIGRGLRSGRMAQKIIENKFLPQRHGLAEEKRDYIDISDACHILIQILNPKVIERINKKTIDLCSGQYASTSELWKIAKSRLPKSDRDLQITKDLGIQYQTYNKDSEWILSLQNRTFTNIETSIINQSDDLTNYYRNKTITIVIDAGGTNTRVAAYNKEGLIEQAVTFKTPNYISLRDMPINEQYQKWLEALYSESTPLINKYRDKILSITIAFAGILDTEGNILGSAVIWKDQNPEQKICIKKDDIESLFRYPVFIINDLTAGIYRYLSSFKQDSINLGALVTISSGIGCKLMDVTHQKVLLDKQGRGGEIGHAISSFTNTLDSEGITGELNSYASGRGIAQLAIQNSITSLDYQNSFLFYKIREMDIDIKLIDKDILTQLTLQGVKNQDIFCIEVLNQSLDHLCNIMHIMILSTAVEKIVLVGGVVGYLQDIYLAMLIDKLVKLPVYGYSKEDFYSLFQIGKCDDNDGLLGAGILTDLMTQNIHQDSLTLETKYTSIVSTKQETDIVFENDIFSHNSSLVNELKKEKSIIFVDQALSYKTKIQSFIDANKLQAICFEIEGSEHNKTLQMVEYCLNLAITNSLPRNCVFVAVGGGALMDVIGVVANLYHRGAKFYKIPTTLLGQVDAGIGIKVGVNYLNKKNSIGSFYPSIMTYCDIHFLKTLHIEQIKEGIGEVLKISIVSCPQLFNILEKYGLDIIKHNDIFSQFIMLAALELRKHLEKDFHELDLWRHVDFGHVIAHGIESASQYQISHGEAVSLDILFSSYIAYSRSLLRYSALTRIVNLFHKLELNYFHNSITTESCKKSIGDSIIKKGGSLKMVIPVDIGQTIFIDHISEHEISAALDFMTKLQQANNINQAEYVEA